MSARRVLIVWLLTAALASTATAPPPHQVLIRDITTVEGVRDNQLIGYGMVVGLNGTGDRRQTVFSTQTLSNILQRMGVQVPPSAVRVNNIAAVFVTASLPPFARPGMRLDVTVSSAGDAKSIEGGLLLLTPLFGPDGQTYAAAQGPLTIGGYTAGASGTSKQVNHPTVGRVADGAIVERDAMVELAKLPRLCLLLRDANFSQAEDVAAAINRDFERKIASAVDSRRIDIAPTGDPIPALLARVENLKVPLHIKAKVVVNERTGTIVMGKEVRLGAVSILQGSLSIEIATVYEVVQPAPLSNGQTAVVPQVTTQAEEKPARRVELQEGATVEQLVSGLQAIGATARDVISVLQAIKAAGGLEAELEVI